jgi:hypothetical protein
LTRGDKLASASLETFDAAFSWLGVRLPAPGMVRSMTNFGMVCSSRVGRRFRPWFVRA